MIQDSAFRTVWAARTLIKMLAILHNHPTFEIGSNHLTLFHLKPSQNKKGQKFSSCTIFDSFFYSWQLRKMVQLEFFFGPSYFVTALAFDF